MQRMKDIAFIGGVLVLLLANAGILTAQTATGEITGTVTDASGAVMPEAKVTVTNQLTNVTWETKTTGTGVYSVPLLPVGVYTVTAEKAGFSLAKTTDIQLNVAQVIRADLRMSVGEVTQVLQVQASAIALNTENAAVTQLINQQQVSELPLNSRNFTSFILLGAGAVDTGDGEQTAMRQDKGGSFSINGARPTSLNYTLDGMINTDVALNTPAVIMSQDAIQEFNEQTETYSAAYGYSANQINIVSKTGTNQLHGSVFEFFRNDAMDARNTFAETKPVLRQNQFGFVAGGPVYIPKIYDGRNKTFWLANYEGWRTRRGNILQGNLPDPAQLSGDFSHADLPAFGTAPCNANLTQNLPCMPIDPQTGLPFQNNMIPSSRFSRLATETLSLKMFPAANCDPTTCGGYNFSQLVTLPTDLDQQNYKIDQELGRFGKVFGRGTISDYSTSTLGTITLPLGNNNFVEHEQSWMVSHTITFGARNVNNFRFGRLQATADQCGTPVAQSVVDTLGFGGLFPNLPDCARSYPGPIGITPFSGVGGPVNDTTLSYIPTWEFDDSFSTFRGSHSLTMGIDFRQWVQNRNLAADFLGTFTYRSDLVLVNGGGCPTPYCGTGNATADFLLGYYQNTGTYQPGPFSQSSVAGNLNQYHFHYLAPYFQDDWKVNPRLTLNMGVRWDYRSVPYEESNKMGWLDLQNPNGGLCIADQSLVSKGVAPEGSMYRYCGRNNPADGSKNVFAPRFGFAWRPTGGDKTVIRGGYGIFFDSAEGREIDDSGDIYPYEVRSTLSPQSQPVTTAPKLTDQLFPAFTTIAPVSPSASTFIAVIISEKPHNPYMQQWSFSIDRMLTSKTTLQVNYIGNKGTHLLTRTDIAQAYAPRDPNFCSATDSAGNYINLNNGDCPVVSRRPYSNFTGVYINSEWQGSSSYNAGNVKLEHRSSTLSLQAIYTWSKSLDDKSAAAGIGNAVAGWNGFMDNHNPKLDYGRSDFDVGQRFVANFLYELPVGRGKNYLSNANRATDAVLGGWRVGGIVNVQGGFPYSVFAQDPLGLLDVIFGTGNRADQIGNPFPSGFNQGTGAWFDKSAFAQPAAAHYGTTGRNIYRGPGFSNVDMNLAKTFSITERAHLEFRAEAFNTFNHPQYGLPDSQMADPTYGRLYYLRHNPRELQLGLKLLF